MVVVTREVGTYEILLISQLSTGGGSQVGYVDFYEPAGAYIGYAGIIRDGAALPANTQWPNGILNFYFHEAALVAMLDTLRNERPVFVKFNTDLKWGSVGTNREPVGEEETPG